MPIPASFILEIKALMSSLGPDTTLSPGAFRAAISVPSGSLSLSSFSPRNTAVMAPGSHCCISLARKATSFRASFRENTPARQAATTSPMEWPSIAVGVTPQDWNSLASAYSTTNSAGWALAVWRRISALSSAPLSV